MSGLHPGGDLRLEAVVVGRGDFRLGPLSFVVSRGRCLAIVGPNGAGKSSLLRALAGLDRVREGHIHRLGASPGPSTEAGPGPVAWLPPPGEVQTGLDVLTVTSLGRAARRPWAPDLSADDRTAARDALAALGLRDLAGRPFDTLSSGQRQLVLLARLHVQEANVCLVDEPTALLDPAHAARVSAALMGLAAPSATSPSGRVVVIATHDLCLAARVDRVLLLGPEPFEGPPEAALTPSRLTALFGLEMAVCPCCGQAVGDAAHVAKRASRPDDTMGSQV